jgi:hypothetical protein
MPRTWSKTEQLIPRLGDRIKRGIEERKEKEGTKRKRANEKERKTLCSSQDNN